MTPSFTRSRALTKRAPKRRWWQNVVTTLFSVASRCVSRHSSQVGAMGFSACMPLAPASTASRMKSRCMCGHTVTLTMSGFSAASISL